MLHGSVRAVKSPLIDKPDLKSNVKILLTG